MPSLRPPPDDELAARAAALQAEVRAWIEEDASVDTECSDAGRLNAGRFDAARFDAVADRLFALQRDGIAAYGGYAGARGAMFGPGRPVWPLLPVAAFKRYPLQLPWVEASATARFETSGTSDGAPGVVRLADTSLYDLAALASFVRYVVPEARSQPARRWRVLCLLPSPDLRPHSSLGHMATRIAERLGDGAGGWLVDGAAGHDVVDIEALARHIEQAEAVGSPVLVLATTLATGLLMEGWPRGLRHRLPDGSRWMDTGGNKGRTLAFDRAATHAWIGATFGLEPREIVGEFGMTELCSQRYEPVQSVIATEAAAWRDAYVGPPWLRSVVLDPATLAPLPDGDIGLVGHIDLANIETCGFVLTADLGRLQPGPFGPALHLAGRLPGAEWRGCGLALEDVAAAIAERR